ncbi:MAG: ATP-binding protein, partial [Planctomycetes bacterium]|nr:ATP-binding protein [Planctomycetota bacterium]
GITCHALTHRCDEPCKGPDCQCPLKEIKKTKKSVIVEHVHYDKYGKNQIFGVHGYPILDVDGNVSLMIEYSLDITKRNEENKELLRQKRRLQFLASELTLTEERERRCIAVALHDNVLQDMIMLNMKLGQLDNFESPNNSAEFLGEAIQISGDLIENMRSLTFDLSSPILYELGLEAAIRRLLKTEIKEKHDIAIQFEDDGSHKPLSEDLRTQLYRSVRELFINIVKHANAEKVKVLVEKDKNTLRIVVADDGVGFQVPNDSIRYHKNGGFGLFSIRERLNQFGGTMDIDSKQGHGTRIILSAPLKEPTEKELEVLV